jgi:4-aminobutyrate aminotransferase
MSASATERLPRIVTELPGPEAKKVLEADERWISPSYTRSYPLVMKRGTGAIIEDVDGNRFLDFNAGVAVCSTGHSHPEVVAAIKAQAEEFIHISGTDYYYPHLPQLAAKLDETAPGNAPRRVHFGNSGAEAVEGAIKVAMYATRRPKLIAFYNSFHGRTMGALSLTASRAAQRRGFGAQALDVTHVPYPNPLSNPFGRKSVDAAVACIKFIEDVVLKTTVPPDECAAIVFEPVQGEGGYIIPPQAAVDELVRICNKYDILLICDEVQAGVGRTGRYWASEHFGLEPDIFTAAKGIASGLPLSATVARAELMSWHVGAHASTFGGNPVAIAAALKTFELLERELLDNTTRMGEYLMDGLKRVQAVYPDNIVDVRGLGLMIGVEFTKSVSTWEPAPELRDRIVEEAFARGLVLLGAGRTAVRFSPPLVVDQDQCDAALRIFEESIAAALRA